MTLHKAAALILAKARVLNQTCIAASEGAYYTGTSIYINYSKKNPSCVHGNHHSKSISYSLKYISPDTPQ